MKQTQILFEGETSALKKNQVRSFPVKADTKLSIGRKQGMEINTLLNFRGRIVLP